MSFSNSGGAPACRAALLLFLLLILSSPSRGGDGPPPPAPRDRCPVCGMFVSKYPDWVSTITYENGTAIHFDGVKDMMKYYFNSGKYHTDKKAEKIETIYVTDYYSMEILPAGSVTFVLGSDVMGPMGEELIPLWGESEVREFIRDHGGQPLTFDEITPGAIP